MYKHKVCCLIGQDELSATKSELVKQKLQEEVNTAIEDGFTMFKSGFTTEVDLIFAEIIADVKLNRPEIVLEAAIPFIKWTRSKNKKYRELIQKCNNISILSEKENPNATEIRDKYIIKTADRLIVVYDYHTDGNIEETIRQMENLGKEIKALGI